MKIDFHVHITPKDIIDNWEEVGKCEDYFNLLSKSPVNKFATAEDVVEELDRSGFDKAVVFGFSFKNMELCQYVNDYVIESVKKYPDRLIGFISINPKAENLREEIERCMDAGLVGIGELFPDGQDFDITCPKEMKNLAEICIEKDLPVLVHTNEPVGHYYDGKTSTTPKEASLFAENFPDLKIIFAHWGGGLPFYEMMPEISKANKNVFYDTAANLFLYDKKIYRIAKELGLMDKILFGSDYPLIPIDRYLDEIEESNLDKESKEKLLGLNAKKLLKL